MKPSDLLFDIIHSLNAQEEASFLNVASLQQGDKNYLKLYEFIKEMETYDEELVKKRFGNEVFIKHLPSEKNQLLHQLLKGLRQRYAQDNVASYIKEELKNVQVLFNKSLYKLARRELDRIKQLAYEHELFFAILEIIDLERIIIDIESRFDDNSVAKIKMLMEEKTQVMRLLGILNRYEAFYLKCTDLLTDGMVINDAQKEEQILGLLSDPLMQELTAIESKRAKIYAYMSQVVIYRLLLKNEEMFHSITAVLDLFEKNEALIAEMPRIYLFVHGFLTRYYALGGQHHLTERIIDKMRALADNPAYSTHDLQVRLFAGYASDMLMFLSYSGQYSRSPEVLSEIIKGLERYEDKLTPDENLFFNYTVAVNYYGCGMLNKTLFYLNKIMNTGGGKKEVLRIARLLNLIVHYELNNLDLLPYLYKSVRRFFDQMETVRPYEVQFLDFFKKYVLSKRKSNHLELLGELERDLMDAFKNPYMRYVLEYFDFFAWIDAQRHHIDYAEALTIKKQTV